MIGNTNNHFFIKLFRKRISLQKHWILRSPQKNIPTCFRLRILEKIMYAQYIALFRPTFDCPKENTPLMKLIFETSLRNVIWLFWRILNCNALRKDMLISGLLSVANWTLLSMPFDWWKPKSDNFDFWTLTDKSHLKASVSLKIYSLQEGKCSWQGFRQTKCLLTFDCRFRFVSEFWEIKLINTWLSPLKWRS